jgi:hypothetical protein
LTAIDVVVAPTLIVVRAPDAPLTETMLLPSAAKTRFDEVFTAKDVGPGEARVGDALKV